MKNRKIYPILCELKKSRVLEVIDHLKLPIKRNLKLLALITEVEDSGVSEELILDQLSDDELKVAYFNATGEFSNNNERSLLLEDLNAALREYEKEIDAHEEEKQALIEKLEQSQKEEPRPSQRFDKDYALNHKGKNYWLWVTKPEFYLGEDGEEAPFLDPENGYDYQGWWTCHKDTKVGDLVLLWRTTPKKDIGYLYVALSDAYSILKSSFASDRGWDYGCEFQSIYKFYNPLTISDLKASPYFDEWKPLKAQFQGRKFNITEEYWDLLTDELDSKNPGYKHFLTSVSKDSIPLNVLKESEIEDYLVENINILKSHGYDLELWKDPVTGDIGRQVVCGSFGGRIDLLCRRKSSGAWVVIELKNVKANDNAFSQVSAYVGWVKNHMSEGEQVEGLVISRGYDTRFELSLSTNDLINQLDLSDIGIN